MVAQAAGLLHGKGTRMKLFLTSSPFIEGRCELNPAHGFLDLLMKSMPQPVHALFVASNPADVEGTESWAHEMKACLGEAGANILTCHALHNESASEATSLVKESNFIMFCGGHVPTQNAFLQRIQLREILKDWDGVVVGISAGSMNCADVVYSLPEEDGEAIDPFYHRFLQGLGLTKSMIIPHYQRLRDMKLDGYYLINQLAVGDSFMHKFYCLPDGSYIYRRGTREELHGPAWVVEDGQVRVANRAGEVLLLAE